MGGGFLEFFSLIRGFVGRSVSFGFALSTSSCCFWRFWAFSRSRWVVSCGSRCRFRMCLSFFCFWFMRSTGFLTLAWRIRSFVFRFIWRSSSFTLLLRNCCCGYVSGDGKGVLEGFVSELVRRGGV